MPRYSVITTCKGRLADLRRSLPQFLKQDDAEVIVVDYDCPDGTAEFARTAYGSVKLVSVRNQPLFNASHARNLGAAHASADLLVFLDADVVVADDFLQSLRFPAGMKTYGIFRREEGNSLRGSCVVRREDFEEIEGYDELLTGYEGEDLDLYMRLRNAGAVAVVLGTERIVEVIDQNDDERFRFRPGNVQKQFLRGQLYQLAKETMLGALRAKKLSLETRKNILEKIDMQVESLFEGEKDFELTINFPDRYRRGLLKRWEFSTAVTVRARRI